MGDGDNGATKQSKFHRQGMGYAYDTGNVRLVLSKIKRGSEYTTGFLYVESTLPGMAGPLVAHRFNLDSLRARVELANHVAPKTPAMNAEMWKDIMDRFCLLVARGELTSESFTTVGDMQGTTKAKWLVENLIREGQPTTLFAPGGTGKSFFALAIGLSIVTGHQFVPGFVPSRKGNVLYLDYETTRPDVDSRVKDLCNGLGVPTVAIGYRRCTTSLGDMVEELSRYIASEDVALLVVDSVEMALASQREANDANQAIIELYKTLRLVGTATLLIDHVNSTEASKTKGNRKPYGSIYKINLARLAFEIRLGNTDGDTSNIALYNIKRNDGRLLQPIGLNIAFRDDNVRYSKQDIHADSTLIEGLGNKERVLSAVQKLNRTVTVKEIAEDLELSEGTVRTLFNDHKDKLFVVVEEGKGKPTLWGLKSPF